MALTAQSFETIDAAMARGALDMDLRQGCWFFVGNSHGSYSIYSANKNIVERDSG